MFCFAIVIRAKSRNTSGKINVLSPFSFPQLTLLYRLHIPFVAQGKDLINEQENRCKYLETDQ